MISISGPSLRPRALSQPNSGLCKVHHPMCTFREIIHIWVNCANMSKFKISCNLSIKIDKTHQVAFFTLYVFFLLQFISLQNYWFASFGWSGWNLLYFTRICQHHTINHVPWSALILSFTQLSTGWRVLLECWLYLVLCWA